MLLSADAMVDSRLWGRLLIAAGLVACGVEPTTETSSNETLPEPDVLADLRADSNRDGIVSVDDDSDRSKTEWNDKTGAIFLANIDDDSERCKSSGDDIAIAKCNDAQDAIVNGATDALDLARLKSRPWPKTPDDATAHVTILTDTAKDRVRIFKKVGPDEADFEALAEDNTFTAAEIQAGFELGIEAKDIVRDSEEWDGYVEIALTVT
ncbi:MAG TPA: hypothetical protein VM580_32230, partial [Labilithrix sp.]|nr:hypothetical protein [Labilithrix sp.]